MSRRRPRFPRPCTASRHCSALRHRSGLRPRSALGARSVRGTACLGALLLLLTTACGDDAAEHPGASPPAPDARLAVRARDLPLQRVPGVTPPQPFSRHWEGASLAAAWLPTDGSAARPDAERGGLLLRGAPRAALVGPRGVALDAEVHHDLVLRLRTERAVELTVYWRAAVDQPWAESRRTVSARVAGSSEPITWSLPLANLRGWNYQRDAADGGGFAKGADASEGLQALRLVFTDAQDPEQRPTTLHVDSIALTSDFDRSANDAGPARMGREHVFHRGTALAVPDAAQLRLSPGLRDRLRASLAVAGGAEPVTLTLRDESGVLPPRSWVLQPKAPWVDVAVELGALAGRDAVLRFETRAGAHDAAADVDGAPDSAPADTTARTGAAVMIGALLHLAPASTPRPNVVFYLEDTLRADRLPPYGYTLPTSPHLARVAQQGVVFEDLFAAANWTRPSTTSLLTALDPVTHGNHADGDRIAESLVTLPELLADAGYVTASLVTNYHAGNWSGLDQGFDVVHEPPAGGASTITSTLTSSVVGQALEALLEEHQGEQLFVYAHSLDPHQPYHPEPRDLAEFFTPEEGAAADTPRWKVDASVRYDAEILFNDRQLARLDAQLERLELLDDTLLVFTSDHGEAFYEHGVRSHRSDLFQEELHVPWILRWPAELQPGRRVDALAGHIDVAPTLAGLLDLEPPASWRGRDLSRLARGETSRVSDTPLLCFTTYGSTPEGGQRQALAVRQGRFKLTAWVDPDDVILPRALFDLEADPGELRDLIDDPAHAEQRERMLAWARDDLARGREAVQPVTATQMDPAMRAWMQEMGYLGK